MSCVIDVSVVIPVYDEELNLPALWSELRAVLERLGLGFEVVFVDDGSRDRSAEIIRSFRELDRRVRLVRLRTNSGETAATDAGFKTARGRLVVVMDADLQNDPADIPRLLSHLDHWDAATGWRVDRAADYNIVHRVSSRIANRIRNWLSNDTIMDSSCTFRAFRRDCLQELVLYRGFHRLIPTLLKMRGYRVIEVPVAHRPRRYGRSKYGVVNRAIAGTVDLLVVSWMNARVFRYEAVEDLGRDLAPD